MAWSKKLEKQVKRDFRNAGGLTGLTRQLHSISANVEKSDNPDDEYLDVRLRYFQGEFYVYCGSSDYDCDHRGFWGAGMVGRKDTLKTCRELAYDLLEQVLEHYAQSV